MARYVEYQREMAYRFFVTDALYESEDHMRVVPQARYKDLINPEVMRRMKRSGDEIADEVIRKGGLIR